MINSQGHATTPLAATYLERLCKHFGKKIPATWDANHGTAEFPFGRCEMEARSDTMFFNCSAADPAAMTQLQNVISSHVAMFTKRSPLVVAWTPPSAPT